MEKEFARSVKDSFTVMTEIVMTSHANGYGRLFGGQLMSWMDVAGGICAKRHSGCEVITVSANDLSFIKSAGPNDVVIITAVMDSVGNTSMKVRITVEVEQFRGNAKGNRVLTCTANFVYVALDENDNKCRVPRLAVLVMPDE